MSPQAAAGLPRHGEGGWLDRPLAETLALDNEKALYGLFMLLAVVSRLVNLGQHLMSHDETVHANWSWYLYQGHGYQHHPLSHGPFLYHATALSYYLFGDNDFTARLAVALLGVALVVMPYTLRHWLGRSGALVTSFLLLISPSLLYYSRYIRNDVPIVVWALLAVLAVFRYLEGPSEHRTRWLVVLAAALSLMFATKEVSFFYIAILGLFLVLLFFARLGPPRRGTLALEQWLHIWLAVLGLLAVILVASGAFLLALSPAELFPIRYRDCGQAPVPGPAPDEMSCGEAGCRLMEGRCQRAMPIITSSDGADFVENGVRSAIRLSGLRIGLEVVLISMIAMAAGAGAYALLRRLMPFQAGQRPALDLILVIGTFTLPFLAHLAIGGLSRGASRAFFGVDTAFDSLDYSAAGLLRSAGFLFILLAVSTAVGVWWDWRRWLLAAGVFYGIFVVLFSTVFTNGNGLASGMVGSLGYWLEQQAVERGSQPLYYYALLVPLYEFLPLIGFAAATLFILIRTLNPTRLRFPYTAASPQIPSLPTVYRLPAQPGLTGLGPAQPGSQHRTAVLGCVTGLRPSTFTPFLLFWTALSWLIYTIAGERMPWMTVHIAIPMLLASGWIIGKLIESIDWRAVLQYKVWLAIFIAPLGLAALIQTVSPWLSAQGTPRPFSGYAVGQLNGTAQFLSALAVLTLSVGVLVWVGRRAGTSTLARVLALSGLAILALLTVRTAWAFAYVNYDDASEFLVYAHASPDVGVVMEQVEEISRRTSGALSLEIGYTSDGSYPFIWYLRNYPNASRLPNPASGPDLDKPVIIAGDVEWAGIEPYLGDRYVCRPYNFMWWPMQDYDDLSWERVRYALTNPAMRGALWDILLRREYRRYEQVTGKTVRLSEWPLRDGFRFCVRRELSAGMWGQDSGTAQIAPDAGNAEADWTKYAGLEQTVLPELEIRDLGPLGSLNSPHGVAQDADGFLYVADTDNHRVVKISPAGQAVDAWGPAWWHGLETWKPNGCLDGADRPLAREDGQFCEPWGVAVGPGGTVYVADTWNHRVQSFSPDGRFLSKVGVFGQSGSSASAAPTAFFGPRDLVVDGGDRLFVADTGNKRVQMFDQNLGHLISFGGPGIVEGRMDEPVGLAVGPDGALYVADTWNQRVQVFSPEGAFLRAWPLASWHGQSAFNKPYIAADRTGRVYASDPEGRRLLVFDDHGTPLAVLDLSGAGTAVPPMPAGVHVDLQGRVWVSDAANHRLLRFAALSSGKLEEPEPP